MKCMIQNKAETMQYMQHTMSNGSASGVISDS